MNDPQFQYVQGQARETFPALLAAYEAESRAAVAAESCVLHVRYGPLERQTFDFFAARGRPRGTLAYFHAGYWQSRDKSTFRFIAPAFTAAGLNVALVNYPLCPDVSLAELVDATRASVPAIRAHAAAPGGASPPLVVAGHSAGGHIAVELALSRWPSAPDAIAGIAALSGIFDLVPLVATTLNDRLRLDEAGAMACSPLHRVRGGMVPALIAVGGAETPAFLRQSQRLHKAWTEAGNRSALHVEAEADHFSLLRQLASPGSALFASVLGLFD
ncbi:alpha/beta hydrolase [Variovorax sp. PBL-E5]|uniref:alpha/beta hydrolase n=1 Tax=Variovorax sp. PBL-E5 TaxID=434014 RepID=UPI001316A31D|nr:alpha/beta hydrolase [Variovorax sp. PBL-E5]VTU25062.1 Alpha/beta hydrolase family protein [Variovorax sp. PBL-E5]